MSKKVLPVLITDLMKVTKGASQKKITSLLMTFRIPKGLILLISIIKTVLYNLTRIMSTRNQLMIPLWFSRTS